MVSNYQKGGRMPKKWTEEEKQLLRELWPTTTLREIQKRIFRSRAGIQTMARELGLKKLPMVWNKFEHVKSLVVQLQQQGKHYTEIAKLVKMNPEYLRRCMKSADIPTSKTMQQKSGFIGETLALRYFRQIGWNVEKCSTNAVYDFTTDDKKINVKHGSTAVTISQNNLERSEVGTIFLCIFMDSVYHLRLDRRDKVRLISAITHSEEHK
jgi:hypothetical protein